MAGRKLGLRDVMLSTVCVTLTVEACAPAAAIGNSAVFWWLLLLGTFLLPYGLVVCELGCAYPEDAGVYGWVRRALGDRWASRQAWWYWVNYTTWLAAVALLVPSTLDGALSATLGLTVPVWVRTVLGVAFVWLVMCSSQGGEGREARIMRVGAVASLSLACGLGVLGIWYGTTHGFANPVTASSLLPDLADPSSVTYLSVILYNYMGCEVVATLIGSMEDPQRDMPRAIVLSGATVAAVYLFASLGISSALPAGAIRLDSGLTDAVAVMAGRGSGAFVLASLVFVVSLFSNMASWSHGVCVVVGQAARDRNLPNALARPELATGVVASVFVVASPVLDALGVGVFSVVLQLDVVFTLLSYVPMFPAFLRLRKMGADRKRPFRVPGGRPVLMLACWAPVVELGLATAVAVVPLGAGQDQLAKVPLLVATAIVLVAGETGAAIRAHRHPTASGPLAAAPEARHGWIVPVCPGPLATLAPSLEGASLTCRQPLAIDVDPRQLDLSPLALCAGHGPASVRLKAAQPLVVVEREVALVVGHEEEPLGTLLAQLPSHEVEQPASYAESLGVRVDHQQVELGGGAVVIALEVGCGHFQLAPVDEQLVVHPLGELGAKGVRGTDEEVPVPPPLAGGRLSRHASQGAADRPAVVLRHDRVGRDGEVGGDRDCAKEASLVLLPRVAPQTTVDAGQGLEVVLRERSELHRGHCLTPFATKDFPIDAYRITYPVSRGVDARTA
ncbi:MAG: APC family permease [Olsenella sp.]|nr:APC family permease [Olsenella sp.]